MPRNKLEDLNNHLFEQLERLNDEDISSEQLEKEMRRAEAMAKIADQIVKNGHLALRACEFSSEYGLKTTMPEMLTAPAERR